MGMCPSVFDWQETIRIYRRDTNGKRKRLNSKSVEINCNSGNDH